MDRFDLARIAEEVDREAYAHNRSDLVARERMTRNGIVNNVLDYHTGEMTHELQVRQIAGWEEWMRLEAILPIDTLERELIYNPPTNIIDLINHYETGHGNVYGDVRAALLREVNHETGIHRAILMIYTIPHREFEDGIVLATEYSYGDDIHTAIRVLFDESPNVRIERLTEMDVIGFVEDHADASRLITEYFQPGFISMIFSDDEYNQAVPFQAIPPPRPPRLDLAHYYFAEMNNELLPGEDEDAEDAFDIQIRENNDALYARG
jgi:hypothetical protein